MSKWQILFLILLILVILDYGSKIYIYSIWGFKESQELVELEKDIKQLQDENMKLELQIYGETSYRYIEQQASISGYVEVTPILIR